MELGLNLVIIIELIPKQISRIIYGHSENLFFLMSNYTKGGIFK